MLTEELRCLDCFPHWQSEDDHDHEDDQETPTFPSSSIAFLTGRARTTTTGRRGDCLIVLVLALLVVNKSTTKDHDDENDWKLLRCDFMRPSCTAAPSG
jgi:hypothetical protein